ncbi:MAG TPA: YceI family protein [Caulobacteraceae bacterium]|nr:YceI family protein [Caulobacteraceae bacterium]
MDLKMLRTVALGAGLALATAGAAAAQGMPTPSHDYKAAPAGKYAVDPKHTGLVARVPHLGFSYSVFRFTGVAGTLAWDPANPAADKLDVTVDPKSIATAPTPGFDFPGELTNDKFLNAAKFPQFTFASTAFHPASATHGTVEGDLTIMGVTKHVTFDVDLVGAGKGFKGPVIGVTAKTMLDPKGLGLPAQLFGAPIELDIDTEFDAQA